MNDKTKLSERVRPDSEAAPWVIEEIEALERQLDRSQQSQSIMTLAYVEGALWSLSHFVNQYEPDDLEEHLMGLHNKIRDHLNAITVLDREGAS